MPDGSPSMAREDTWSGDPADDPLFSDLIDAPEEQSTTAAPDPSAEPEPVGAEETEPALDQTAEPVDDPATQQTEEQAPVEQTATAETEGTEAPAEQYSFGGRTFASQEAAEESYRQAQAKMVADATRANRAEAALAQREADLAQMRADVQRLLPLIQQAPPQGATRPAIDPSLLERAGIDPEAAPILERLVKDQVAQRLSPLEQQLQAERERAATEAQRVAANSEAEALRQAQTTFQLAHPDYEQHEQAMLDVMADLELVAMDPATGKPVPLRTTSGQLALSDPSWYEVAYEVARDPELRKVIRANPHLSETDEGMELARDEAARRHAKAARAAQATQPQAAAPAPNPAAGVHVLTGPANTPAATTQAERDAIDEILDLDRSARHSPWTGGGL